MPHHVGNENPSTLIVQLDDIKEITTHRHSSAIDVVKVQREAALVHMGGNLWIIAGQKGLLEIPSHVQVALNFGGLRSQLSLQVFLVAKQFAGHC